MMLSDEFLADIRGIPHRNLAVELLEKLLKGEIGNRSSRMLDPSPCSSSRQSASTRTEPSGRPW